MNINHFHKFKEYEEKGLKKKASEAVRGFIDSFENDEEREDWVLDYLSSLKLERHSKIRHEIFAELVYPILKNGYINQDFNSMLWLGKLAQNLYQNRHIHEEMDWVTELFLFKRSLEINPENDESRLLFLSVIVAWLEYSEHEWPSGILYGNDGATPEQCDEILVEVQRVMKLDKEHRYSAFIKQYIKKLNEYRERLNK